jgi:hypothetical protein
MLARVPWIPEHFSAPALQQILDNRRQDRLRAVPFFDGLMSGEVDALVASFAGVPEVHHPVDGLIAGEDAFRRFAGKMAAWLRARHVAVEDVNVLVAAPRSVEEVVLHLDAGDGRIGVPLALAAEHDDDARIVAVRMYCSTTLLAGHRVARAPLLASDPGLHVPGPVGEVLRALAAGDLDAVVAAFDPGGSVRDAAGEDHRGAAALRAFYARRLAAGPEPCTITDDGRACALEYNVVAWGRTPLPPQAGLAVYVRGSGGKLAAARIYDDADPPLGHL